MDSLTQIALGASVAAAVGIKPFGRKVLITGALLGTLPDLDVLLNYQTAIENFTFHRSFSHSLFVLATLSLMLYYAVILYNPKLSAHKLPLFLVIFLPLITHPLLDAFTTYGTQLWWPMQSPPISLSSIFIIDPLYTIPLLVAGIGLWLKQHSQKWQKINLFMLGISSMYLIQGYVQHWYIKQQVMGDPITHHSQIFISPTPFNTAVWRVLSYHNDVYYEAFTNVLNDTPLRWQTFSTGRMLIDQFDSTELQRLEWFSGGLLQFVEEDKKLVVTDLRIGLTHFYPFSFSLAERHNQWEPIPSSKMPQADIDWRKVLKW
jgi:inner membrane protein